MQCVCVLGCKLDLLTLDSDWIIWSSRLDCHQYFQVCFNKNNNRTCLIYASLASEFWVLLHLKIASSFFFLKKQKFLGLLLYSLPLNVENTRENKASPKEKFCKVVLHPLKIPRRRPRYLWNFCIFFFHKILGNSIFSTLPVWNFSGMDHYHLL